MQYDIDMTSEFRDIFLTLEAIILAHEGIKIKKNAKQTAFYDLYSAVCFLRPHNDKKSYCLSLAKGASLQHKYPFLKGDGKIARHLYFGSVDEIDRELIDEIIRETMILNLEAYELKRLRKRL